MVVQHNVTAMNANRQLGITTGIQAKSSEKLSSGYKINRAADDAAGLAISEKMRRQVRGLTQASANAQDGISAVQTAEGALNEVHDMLQRMNELATKAANDTLTTKDRDYIQSEITALTDEINRTGEATSFNDTKLLNGNFKNKNLQVGSENNDKNLIKVSIDKMTASGIGVSGVTVAGSTGATARTAMDTIKSALEKVSQQRSDLGAIQNRLEHTIKNLDNVVENTQAAESLIRDTDMATEMVKYSNNNILAQAGQSMLAQANQTNQGVLSLLG
ncbi:flagellin [Butyrivibrio sp. X503]|uniref:flagellin N-terminal helical domain-containing protein n=1 Tax=Butyrivibrio sp. X503 TaxID=2364878 RepID=UPI000EAA7AA9|nr:flagellin [Butyrivibrio sp. X503]MBR4669466.1 flagellin [Butyrivibrio sp.]RKM54338.1 flagellin [Butyrivibrio sp. X503]